MGSFVVILIKVINIFFFVLHSSIWRQNFVARVDFALLPALKEVTVRTLPLDRRPALPISATPPVAARLLPALRLIIINTPFPRSPRQTSTAAARIRAPPQVIKLLTWQRHIPATKGEEEEEEEILPEITGKTSSFPIPSRRTKEMVKKLDSLMD